MYYGELVWWNPAKATGIIEVIEDGTAVRFFLLGSKLSSAPLTIVKGQFVKFVTSRPAHRPDLLPTAVGVVISEQPFPERRLTEKALSVLSGAQAGGVE